MHLFLFQQTLKALLMCLFILMVAGCDLSSKNNAAPEPTSTSNSNSTNTAESELPGDEEMVIDVRPPMTKENSSGVGQATTTSVPAEKSQSESTPDSVASVAAATASPSTPITLTNKREVLKYKLGNNNYEYYPFELIPKDDSGKRITGSSSFLTRIADNVTIEKPTVEASGTGWVISSDGYLITCAHVVDGARSIDVTLNNHVYPATVVALDSSLDLALIKIEANNLVPLTLATDKSVEQGQEVRSVGFPLSSVLGESVKINRGSIAGFVNLEGRVLVQIDVPINPGNSGGPVVDLGGNVIGVASEKLAGIEISSVGFCVPTAVLRQWLSPHLKSFATATASQELSGVELSKKVTPGVALVKVTIGGSDPNAKNYALTGMSYFSIEDNRAISFNPPNHENSKYLVNDSGVVLEAKDHRQLPFLMGNLSTFPLPELSNTGATKWSVSEKFQLTAVDEQAEEPHPLDALLMRRGRFGFGGRQPERVVTLIPAIRVEKFHILSTEANVVSIEKKWEVITDANPNNQTILSCSGKGIWKFDRELGMMLEFKGEGLFTSKNSEGENTLPFELTMNRKTEEISKAIEKNKEKEALAGADTQGSSGDNQTNSDAQSPETDEKVLHIKNLVASLAKDKEPKERLTALKKLTTIEVLTSEKRGVISALLENMRHDDPEVKAQAVGALSHWDNASKISYVIKLLKEEDERVLTSAIQYLGDAWDPQAADELAALAIEKPEFRERAMAALTEIGPAAEEVVLGLLDNEDVDICKAACVCLGKIGGPASIKKLRKLIAGSHSASTEAQAALKEIGVKP